MKKSLSKQTVAGIVMMSIIIPISLAAHATDLCGLLSEVSKEATDSPRFRILLEFDGKAFLDMETCLVWRLDEVMEPQTLNDAMYHCANEGQGGPQGRMGWQLPLWPS